jgi:hypothetical protein
LADQEKELLAGVFKTISSIADEDQFDATKKIMTDCLVGAKMAISCLDVHKYRTFTAH